MIAGQVGFAGHLTIDDNVKIAAQSGIGANIKKNTIVQGSPAFPIRDYQKSYVHFRNLSKMEKRLSDMEKYIEELKSLIKK